MKARKQKQKYPGQYIVRVVVLGTVVAVTFDADEEARVKSEAAASGLSVEDFVAKAVRDKADRHRVGWSCQDELHALISRVVSELSAPKRSAR